jgi:membrane-bound lytic murein transglycosylase A
MSATTAGAPYPARLVPTGFGEIPGWDDDDHAAALSAFRRSAAVLAAHPPKARAAGIDIEALATRLAEAAALPDPLPRGAARRFFEDGFAPHIVEPESGGGFFTGYYEPIVAGARRRTERFNAPLYGVPDDLVEFDPAMPPPGINPTLRFARKTADGFTAYPDRAAIEDGLLAGRGLELAFVADPVDAFFIQIQGSARIALAEGGTMRVTYAAKTGHSYTPIGRVMVEMGALERGAVTMQTIRAWLATHPGEVSKVLRHNRSFVFFREAAVDDEGLGPVAAAKVPLTRERSLAVDRLLYPFHLPVFIDTTLAGGAAFRRLLIAQDTGSAIVGPARGDIFFGSGDAAGETAGAMQAAGRFIVLMPRGAAR